MYFTEKPLKTQVITLEARIIHYMKLSVHQATAADTNDLLVILNEALRFKLAQDDATWETTPWTLQEATHSINGGATYIAVVNGQPAGSVVLIWEDERAWGEIGLDNKAGYIHRLAVRDSFRGQQVGIKIMDWCLDQIREHGRPYARLDCPAGNKKLCQYYEKQGFQRKGTSVDHGNNLYERTA